MNKFVLISFLFICVLVLKVCSNKQILKFEENTFTRLHKRLTRIYNKIFLALKLSQNFTKTEENRLLLSMHANMKTISEKNSQYNKYVKLLCKTSKRKMKEGLLNFNTLIDVLLEEYLVPNSYSNNTYTNITFRSNIHNETKHSGINFKLSSHELPDNFEESVILLRDYLHTVGLPITDFETPSDKIRNLYEQNTKILKKKRKHLKSWKFSNITENAPNTRRIFNGKTGRIASFPFMASVHVMDQFVCAGSIINKEIVITAASCLHIAYKNAKFLRQNHDGITVRMGSDNTRRYGELCKATVIHFHPEYDPVTLRNNLALIRIEKRFYFKENDNIRRVRYSKSNAWENVSSEVLMVGWGAGPALVQSLFEMLAYSHLELYDLARCKEIYSTDFVTDQNFCAGFVTKGSGACKRDIGGPGIVESFLVGVVSFGPPVCGTPDAPTVFTALGNYAEWINSIIENHSYYNTKKSTLTTKASSVSFIRAATPLPTNDNTKQDRANIVTEFPNSMKFLAKFLENIFIESQKVGVKNPANLIMPKINVLRNNPRVTLPVSKPVEIKTAYTHNHRKHHYHIKKEGNSKKKTIISKSIEVHPYTDSAENTENIKSKETVENKKTARKLTREGAAVNAEHAFIQAFKKLESYFNKHQMLTTIPKVKHHHKEKIQLKHSKNGKSRKEHTSPKNSKDSSNYESNSDEGMNIEVFDDIIGNNLLSTTSAGSDNIEFPAPNLRAIATARDNETNAKRETSATKLDNVLFLLKDDKILPISDKQLRKADKGEYGEVHYHKILDDGSHNEEYSEGSQEDLLKAVEGNARRFLDYIET